MTEYLPGMIKTVAMKAAKIRDVVAEADTKETIGVASLNPSDLYRVRYEVATIHNGSHYLFFECNPFRMRVRFGLGRKLGADKQDYENWLLALTASYESNDWNVEFLEIAGGISDRAGVVDLGHNSSFEWRATVGLPKNYIWQPDLYMQLAAQVAAAMGMMILAAQKHDFETLPVIPDRTELELGDLDRCEGNDEKGKH